MDEHKIPEVDGLLLAVSGIPFLAVSAPVETLMSARIEGAFLGAIVLAGICAMVSKPIFGWGHIASRLVLLGAGLWGVIGSGHHEYAVIIPGNLGSLAQYLWIAGLIILLHVRNKRLKASILLLKHREMARAAASSSPSEPRDKIKLIR